MLPSYTYAKLPRAGLGNKLLVWARALVFSNINCLPLFVSNWAEFKIGPIIRNERTKRQYWGYFKGTNSLSSYRRLRFIFLKRMQEPSLLSVGMKEGFLYTFNTTPAWPDYFKDLHEHRSLIIEQFKKVVSTKYLIQAMSISPPVIGVHVRRTDFRQPLANEVLGSACNQRSNLSYYIKIIQVLRSIHGEHLPVTVFTDGRDDDVEELLSLPAVKIAKDYPDIVDLLLLSRSRYIVISPGSTFSYWAAFISDATVITHSKFYKRIRPDNLGLFEGSIDDYVEIL